MRDELSLQQLASRARQSRRSIGRMLASAVAGPALLVVLVGLFQLVLWGALSGVLAVAPPDDSLEQVLLSQDLRLEYGKHPPLPTWLLYASNRLFGASIGSTYVLGALCSVATMLLLFGFARPLVGATRAALAAILMSNIEYMNAGTAYFNHNTVQLPLALLAIVLFHRALARMRWVDWALFGAGAGLMLLAKFSAIVLFASFAVYLVWSGRLASGPVWRGLAIAILVGGVMISPYLLAVRADHWSANAYAAHAIFPDDVDRIQCLKTVWGFASSQLAKVMPALLIFAFVRRGAAPSLAGPATAPSLMPFLTIVGFGPLVLTVVIAALAGARLLVGWGTTFHVLLTLWLVAVPQLAFEVRPRRVRRAALASIAVQTVMWALVVTHGGRLPNLNPTPHPARPPTPEALANAARTLWAEHCAAPFRYVLTDGHTGAALAVRYQGQPRVVDAMRPERTKFFPLETQITDGAVVVRRGLADRVANPPSPRDPLDDFMTSSAWHMSIELPASDGSRQVYALGVLLPLAGKGCEY